MPLRLTLRDHLNMLKIRKKQKRDHTTVQTLPSSQTTPTKTEHAQERVTKAAKASSKRQRVAKAAKVSSKRQRVTQVTKTELSSFKRQRVTKVTKTELSFPQREQVAKAVKTELSPSEVENVTQHILSNIHVAEVRPLVSRPRPVAPPRPIVPLRLKGTPLVRTPVAQKIYQRMKQPTVKLIYVQGPHGSGKFLGAVWAAMQMRRNIIVIEAQDLNTNEERARAILGPVKGFGFRHAMRRLRRQTAGLDQGSVVIIPHAEDWNNAQGGKGMPGVGMLLNLVRKPKQPTTPTYVITSDASYNKPLQPFKREAQVVYTKHFTVPTGQNILRAIGTVHVQQYNMPVDMHAFWAEAAISLKTDRALSIATRAGRGHLDYSIYEVLKEFCVWISRSYSYKRSENPRLDLSPIRLLECLPRFEEHLRFANMPETATRRDELSELDTLHRFHDPYQRGFTPVSYITMDTVRTWITQRKYFKMVRSYLGWKQRKHKLSHPFCMITSQKAFQRQVDPNPVFNALNRC